ncbi:response regulator transcription factor [Luteimonas sp. SX5]|uniref:Response regulator transcription factor n=1 Tax=Luteimonas galliterrae TaxID=2940486 RepID=A0ABT0MGH3_9GAMM|nr:response regulator transcription factor [Luteimonas galliterrae]MCL1633967.1 response regulator transcription factor [Luteimonas galliterrae]
MSRVRVLLAEDGPAMAKQLLVLLSKEFDVVGMVEDGFSLVQAARRMNPDVVVTDISMPGLDGLEAIRQLRRERADLHVVFITVHADRRLVERAMKLGPCGYVVKSVAGEDLLAAVNAVVAGESYVSGSIGSAGDRA